MQGSVEEFRANWKDRPETKYCHFTRGEPVNQIQFAFRKNWLEFAKIMEPLKPWHGKRCLEVGAGRGTMSMYFADNGFQCTLLDACEEPLNQAKEAFTEHGLSARYVLGDALEMLLADESFDVVFSYGLLEHFEVEPLRTTLAEQTRVLKSGGLWLAYVPPNPPNYYFPGMSAVTEAIRLYAGVEQVDKTEVFRNGYAHYGRLFPDGCFRESLRDCAVYPFPMIGASIDFPFTLNPPHIEQAIVDSFNRDMADGMEWRVFDDREQPAQAFIVWGWKQ